MSSSGTHWKVKFLSADGRVQTRSIVAASKSQVPALLGVPQQRISSITRDPLGDLSISLFDEKPKPYVQSIILRVVSGAVTASKDVAGAFDMQASRYKVFHSKMAECRKQLQLSDKMRVLGFDAMAQVMVASGERSGDLDRALKIAADDIDERASDAGDLLKAVGPSFVFLTIGLAMLLIFPFAMKSAIAQITKFKIVKFNPNALTEVLLGIEYVLHHWWFVLVALALAAVVVRAQLWESVRRRRPFRWLDDYYNLRRGVGFVTTYRLMMQSKVPTEEAINKMMTVTKGADSRAFEQLSKTLKRGGNLSSAFSDERYWPDILQNGMSGFEGATHETQDAILAGLGPQMKKLANLQAVSLGRFLNILGLVIALSSTAIVLGGGTFPIINAKPVLTQQHR